MKKLTLYIQENLVTESAAFKVGDKIQVINLGYGGKKDEELDSGKIEELSTLAKTSSEFDKDFIDDMDNDDMKSITAKIGGKWYAEVDVTRFKKL